MMRALFVDELGLEGTMAMDSSRVAREMPVGVIFVVRDHLTHGYANNELSLMAAAHYSRLGQVLHIAARPIGQDSPVQNNKPLLIAWLLRHESNFV
jgi:hypothetical protein